MNAQLESSEAAILSRVIQSDAGDWPQAAAEAILRMGFNETDREQMTALLEKAKAGELSNEESDALEHYRHIGKLLELMKLRARRSLQTFPA
jgi:Ran GTPase-activating protein (RanGAP) involved in mRNA processing and transport